MHLKLSLVFTSTVLLLFTGLLGQRVSADQNNNPQPNGVLKVGRDVSAPRAIYTPDPEYSEQARKAGYQGTCMLSVIVGPNGKPREVTVTRKLGMGLDEKAVQAVRQWKFEAARKAGRPVAVQINVEVGFHLYRNGETVPLTAEQSRRMRELQEFSQSQISRISDPLAPRLCAGASQRDASAPAVSIVDLNIDGDLRMPLADRGRISDSLKRRSYFGSADEVASEIAERAKAEWQNSGYLRAEAQGEAHVLTSTPASSRMVVNLHVDEGQQYKLEAIRFKGNKAITNSTALRRLFPISDGNVVDRAAIAKGLENLRYAYSEYGYVNSTFVPDVQFKEENQTVSLEIDVEEGKQFYVSRVNIVGLSEPDFQTAKHDLLVKPGQIYNERLVDFFLQKHASGLPNDGPVETRIKLDVNEKDALVAMTYDLRACGSK